MDAVAVESDKKSCGAAAAAAELLCHLMYHNGRRIV